MAKIVSGQTTKNDWQDYIAYGQQYGLYVDVNTSSAGFSKTPHYVVTLEGNGYHWRVCGSNAIYNPTTRGFRVYITWADNEGHTPRNPIMPLTKAFAQTQNWHLKWTGIET